MMVPRMYVAHFERPFKPPPRDAPLYLSPAAAMAYADMAYDPRMESWVLRNPPRSGIGQPSTLSTPSSQVGAGLLSTAGTLTAINPIAGGVVALAGGIAELVGAVAGLFSGCGQTCVLATKIVDQAEPYFQQNVSLYLNNPGRTVCDQQLHLATFDQMWAQIVQGCSNPSLGTAGQRCISDRASGCKWQKNGACWNWFIGYRDPIANDVPPGGSACLTTGAGTAGGLTTSYAPLVLAAALIIGVAFL